MLRVHRRVGASLAKHCFTRTSALHTMSQPAVRFFDIGINFTDDQYQGIYRGRKHHEADLGHAVSRAQSIGCSRFLITGSDLAESENAISIARKFPRVCFTTVGVHPCSVGRITQHPAGPQSYLGALETLIRSRAATNSPISAFGEIGLDYDRLDFSSKEDQLTYFAAQLDIACSLDPPLPLFLHSRAAAADFARLLSERLDRLPKRGVVHSFTGSAPEMRQLLDMGFDIGLNGCSLKTEENLQVVRELPLERLHLETDGPWCEIRATHASSKLVEAARKEREGSGGYEVKVWESVKKERWREGVLVKGRNESCRIGEVAAAVAAVKGVSIEELAEHAWRNSTRVFGL